MGLVDEHKYEDLFARYLLNVTYQQKGEKLYNEKTGASEPADLKLIGDLERIWQVTTEPERFRRDLVSRVGAWRVENRGEAIPWRRLFPKLIEGLEEDYYAKQRARVQRQLSHVMTVMAADQLREDPVHQGVAAADVAKAREVIGKMMTDHKYPPEAVRETLAALLKHRY